MSSVTYNGAGGARGTNNYAAGGAGGAGGAGSAPSALPERLAVIAPMLAAARQAA